MKGEQLTNISAVKPLTSLLGGALEASSLESRNGFLDILFGLSMLRGEAPAGEAARLRKGLFEERLTERVLLSRAARVFGESCLRSVSRREMAPVSEVLLYGKDDGRAE